MTLEICCGDIASVKAAIDGGADRAELCSALEAGGITPSDAFIAKAVSLANAAPRPFRVHVLIRPRGGDFAYDADELEIIKADILRGKSLGAHGVVIGALDADGNVDMAAMRPLMQAARGMSVTFHRAFDLCRMPEQALEDVIALGCDRILTSGCAASAMQGIDTLGMLSDKARGRIAIMAGAGVNADNAGSLLSGARLTELHASARQAVQSAMRYRRPGVPMGAPGTDEYSRLTTSAAAVAAIAAAMRP